MIQNTILVLICNFFLLLVLQQFFKDFLMKTPEHKYLRWGLSALWFAGVFTVSVVINQPLVNFLVNSILMFLITLSYDGAINRKILVTCIVSVLSAVCDYVAYILVMNYIDSIYAYGISYAFTVILLWLCERIADIFWKEINGSKTNKRELSVILLIPISCIVVLYCITRSGMAGNYITAAGIGIILICLMTFYVYHIILNNYVYTQKQKMLEQQVAGYRQELKRIQNSELRIEGLRHDMHHHLIALEGLAENGDINELLAYIKSMEDDINYKPKLARSGYYEIDSLINYMLDEVREQLSDLKVKIAIPHNLDFSKYYLNIILGNLLENAIYAAVHSSERFLHINIKVEKGIFCLEIINSYNGEIRSEGDRLISTKGNNTNHGIGIQNVKRIIEDMHGELRINTDNNRFRANAFVYLNQ